MIIWSWTIGDFIYLQVLEKIRQDVGDRKVFIQVDETTDKAGRYVANVLVGALNKDAPPKAHLIMTKQLESTNNNTVTQLIIDSLRKHELYFYSTWIYN